MIRPCAASIALFLLPLSLAAAEAPQKPYGREAAEAAMVNFTTAPGLAAELFAAEPQIRNPTNIDVDPAGRVWAVEAVNYRSTMKAWGILRPEGDRVVILEKKADGSGVQETTFWQSPELTNPLGICVLPQEHGTKVIVSAAPNVWLLTDADGDGHAEKAQKLFTVGGNWDHDHQVHAFVFGPDGKFYFNMGNEARKLMTPDGKTITDLAGNPVTADGHPYRQGMVFRCDLDLEKGEAHHVETLGWNFRNNYEVTVDSFGTLWQLDNDDDGNKGVRINYVMQYGNYGYSDEMTGAGWRADRTNIESEIPRRHWHQNDPGTIPNLLQTGGGSPTGILINEGTRLGPAFANTLIHCDAGPRVVRAYPVKPDGAGYRAEMIDLLTTPDTWFRPSDVAIAPDGSLLVADWYDPGVGGHNMGDHEAGRVRGRIYRVAPPGTPYTITAPDLSTDAGLRAALESPNRATWYVAWRTLQAAGERARGVLHAALDAENPRLRARALGILAASGQPASALEAVRRGLHDREADVRIATIRLAAELSRGGGVDLSSLQDEPELLRGLMRDPDPRVRREIALALHGGKEIASLWTALTRQYDGHDRWYLEALGIGAAGNDEACLETWLDAVGPDGWNTPAGHDLVWRLRTAKTLPLLARLLENPQTSANEAPRYLRAFDFAPASEEKTAILSRLAALKANDFVSAEALSRLRGVDLGRHPELRALILDALGKSRGTPRFVELVRDFRLPGQADGLLEITVAKTASPEAVEAAKLLLSTEPARLQAELAGAHAPALVEVLGNTADARAVPLLLPRVQDAAAPAELRKKAVRSLAQSQAGVEAMLQLAGEGKFPEDLRFAATQALAAVQMPKLKEGIAKAFPAPNALGGQTLPPIAELARRSGRPEHGRELFLRETSSCITCHRIGQEGVDFGPGLSEIGTKLGKEAIFEAIIDPNAGVAMGFETTQLTLKDGSAAVGIVRSETEEQLTLAMPRGVQVPYRKSEIASRVKLPTSMMPSGLNQALSIEDLVDLVSYLSSLKAAGK